MADKQINVQKYSEQEFNSAMQNTINSLSESAKDFYQADVVPRAKRERSLWDKWSLETPQWLPNVNIIVGNNQKHSLNWNEDGVSGYYDLLDRDIHLRPVNNRSDVLVHEMGHANEYIDIVDKPWWLAKYGILGNFIRSFRPDYKRRHISNSEYKLLNRAYQTDENSLTPDSNNISEKLQSNRQLRYKIWIKLKEQLGRNPTLEETDEYIKKLSDSELRELIFTNDYIYDYMNHPEYNSYDTKNALMHVAQNNTHNNKQLYASRGGKFNKPTLIPKQK